MLIRRFWAFISLYASMIIMGNIGIWAATRIKASRSL
jgi:hypothetical protein